MAWDRVEIEVVAGSRAYAIPDNDARTNRVNLRNGGHSNRNPEKVVKNGKC